METVVITKKEIEGLREEVLEEGLCNVGYYKDSLMKTLEWDELQYTLKELGNGFQSVEDIFQELISSQDLDIYQKYYMTNILNYGALVHSKLSDETFYKGSYKVVSEDGRLFNEKVA